jgi:ATP-dependent Lhr-like helicase
MAPNVFDSVGFHPLIKRWFTQRFANPSPPQTLGWPSIADAQHTLILAPTGSGKTLAAFLWSLDQLLRRALSLGPRHFSENRDGIHTLYISPLKALNNDIHRNLTAPLKEIHLLARAKHPQIPPIRVAVRTGDTPAHVRQSMLRQPPHILITTPESLYLLLGTDRGRDLFRPLQYVIVDEIHAISGNKRGVHLSLSLERLMPLCRNEPIRIGLSATQKPLDRIAAYLGGQPYDRAKNIFCARPVRIIDGGHRKKMDLKVITPVKTFNELPESSVWQPAYQTLYELIGAHRTTLVFAGMRAQTEKIARALNQLHRRITGDPSAELALAHHGSISREARYSIEARLKAGDIPAVIATASLELGIDIGSIDLVVHLEAPRSVAGALQRVGRSGHLLSATSKGRIMVLYPADLDDAVAIARSMVQTDIEQTRIPENALDVLAQQIVAEVAVKAWNFDNLYRLVRGSYCYRDLAPAAFRSVVQMLCGKFSDLPLQALTARLNWDQVNNRLIARRGSRLAAAMNGGTIPDRGYYGVYLENANLKLGEVEEEFAFESRVGEVFYLGNSEWLIKQLMQDRIIVSPVAAINPRAPFWKGGILFRDYSTSRKIGRFRRSLLDQMGRGRAESWLMQKCSADENTAHNLVQYFDRQRKRGRSLATDRQVIAEITIDGGGNPLLVLHAPFGARVNGAWAIAMSAALEQHYQTQFQYSFDDDGMLIRLPDTTEPPPLEKLFAISPSQVEAYLMKSLPQSPIFVVHFRYNAARSLMLPRSHPGKRIPLWLQRLRASDLLQATAKYQDFPVIIETYRECLQDVFDLAGLKRIIADIEKGRIGCQFVNTSNPSPMAAGLLFKFESVYLYEEDRHRQPREGFNISTEILEGMLQDNQVPGILTPELIRQAEKRWQHLDPYFQAGTAEELFDIIEKLGPLAEDSLVRRSKVDPSAWLDDLKAANRIMVSARAGDGNSKRMWRINQIEPAVSGGDGRADISERVRRYLRVRGPVSIEGIKQDLALPQTLISATLNRMLAEAQVVHGRLVQGLPQALWCDRHNFTRLYRTAIARRRTAQHPADRTMFNRFLLQWHGIERPQQHWREVVQRYRGYRFPPYFFEREILRSRCAEAGGSNWQDRLAEFEAQISSGHIIVHTGRNGQTGQRYVEFRMRGEGNLFDNQQGLREAAGNLSPSAKIIYDFLHENGASYGRDLDTGTGLTPAELHRALKELAEKGLASCENYPSFLATVQSRLRRSSPGRSIPGSRSKRLRSWGSRSRGSRPRGATRAEVRHRLQQKSRLQEGRWFLTISFAVRGKPIDENQRTEAQARLLLQRYGVLVKEWYRREQGFLAWHRLFQMLKRLEWQGQIRRGYFVAGLSGVQFALPEAVELLDNVSRRPCDSNANPILLSSLDPALPFGGGVDWGQIDINGNPLQLARSASNHLALVDGEIVLVGENFFQRLRVLKDLSPPAWQRLGQRLREYLKMPDPIKYANRIEIRQINNLAAAESPWADHLLETGFEKDGQRLVLWPSAIGRQKSEDRGQRSEGR